MDDGDRAQEWQELHNAQAVLKRKQTYKPCGYCYNCNERCRGSFCDRACEEDHAKRERK